MKNTSNNITLILVTIVLSAIVACEACHGKPAPARGDGENKDVRKKRSVVSPKDARKDMSDFFTECMLRKSGPNIIPQMQALVESVLRDSNWYQIVDNYICGENKDTRNCWNSEVDGLFDWTSPILGTLRECLLEYEAGRKTGGFRQKRGANSWPNFQQQTIRVNPDPPCPQVTDQIYGSCMEEEVNKTAEYPSLENFHWESIAIFLREHYSRCRYEQVDAPWTPEGFYYRKKCSPYRYKTTSGDMAQSASQQCVPFLLQEYIREESPLQTPSDDCNEFFRNVSFILDGENLVEEPKISSWEAEVKRYGPRGKHNGADILGYCDPKAYFTAWFNNITEDGTGDFELLSEIRRRNATICRQPTGIQIRVAQNDEPWYTSGNNFRTMSPNEGLRCLNSMQHHKPCPDFKVRFCCFVSETSSTSTNKYPRTPTTVGTCEQNDRWGYWLNIDSSSGNGGDFEYFRSYGMPDCEPVAVQGRIRGSNRPYTQAHNNLQTEDPKLGIVCKDDMQPKERPCRDFEVRFCCKNGRGILSTTARPVTKRPTPTASTMVVIR